MVLYLLIGRCNLIREESFESYHTYTIPFVESSSTVEQNDSICDIVYNVREYLSLRLLIETCSRLINAAGKYF